MESQNLCEVAKALINGVVKVGTMEAQQTVLGKPFPLVLVPVDGERVNFIGL